MKANAPEKIYIVDATFPDYVDFDGSPINTKRIDDHDIEYIRKDAFIEKAEKFFEDNLTEEDCEYRCIGLTEVKTNYVSKDSFIRAFRNYIKN